MTARPELRIGLAGAGFLATTRARCWRRVHGIDVQLVAVTASQTERAEVFAREHSVPHALAGLEALISRDDVDLVDVCLPNHLHRQAVELAAMAGKPVVCTKPLSAYTGQDLPAEASDADVAARERRVMASVAVGDARAMLAASQAADVQLMYGENWIYAPSIVRAAGLLAAGRGAVLELRGEEAHSGSHSAYARTWRHAGGGALLRLGAHPIGAMLHLKRVEGLARDGAPIGVTHVSAELADPVAGAPANAPMAVAAGARDVETWGCAVLHFADGSRGTAFGSDLSLGGMNSRLELRTSDARLICNLSPHDLLQAYTPSDGGFGDGYVMEKVEGQAGWSTPLPDEDWSSGHQGMLQAFAEAAVRGEPPAADGWLGLEVTRVLAAAYVSAAEGQRVALQEPD